MAWKPGASGGHRYAIRLELREKEAFATPVRPGEMVARAAAGGELIRATVNYAH